MNRYENAVVTIAIVCASLMFCAFGIYTILRGIADAYLEYSRFILGFGIAMVSVGVFLPVFGTVRHIKKKRC